MIFMTLIIAVQPLYLRNVLGIGRENAGFINANIQVITELVDLFIIGYLGYLSDRYGRVPLIFYGFLLAGFSAILVPFSHLFGVWIGIGGLAFFYLMRITMSLGTAAVWPQLITLAGDFSDIRSRPKLIANAGFMLAFGATLSYAVLVQIPQHAGTTAALLLGALIAFAGAWIARNLLIVVTKRLK